MNSEDAKHETAVESTIFLTPDPTVQYGCFRRALIRLKLSNFKKTLQHILLLATLITYTVIGGIVFKELEHPNEELRLTNLHEDVFAQRLHFMQMVVNNSHLDNLDQLLSVELRKYEIVLENAVSGGLTNLSQEVKELQKWSLIKAIFFSSTIITTIGYGDVVPVTTNGRIFCIFYALIGIPLTLTVLADWGGMFATLVSTMMQQLPSITERLKHGVTTLYVVLALGFFCMYLSFGAFLFIYWEEDWSFFDGFYFCFITMTTIGFGDIVPEKPSYMWMATMYILIGLALTSTIIELVRRQYAQSWRQLQALSGPLADNLRKLAENAPGLDVSAFQQDLRKVLTVVTMPRKFNMHQRVKTKAIKPNSTDWEAAMEAVIKDITETSQRTKPPMVQIVIYESSV